MQCKYRPRSVQIVGWLVGVAVIRLAKEMIKKTVLVIKWVINETKCKYNRDMEPWENAHEYVGQDKFVWVTGEM